MKPRTVILTLELQDCTERLDVLRKIRSAVVEAAHPNRNCTYGFRVEVAQATAAVAQPSGRPAARKAAGR